MILFIAHDAGAVNAYNVNDADAPVKLPVSLPVLWCALIYAWCNGFMMPSHLFMMQGMPSTLLCPVSLLSGCCLSSQKPKYQYRDHPVGQLTKGCPFYEAALICRIQEYLSEEGGKGKIKDNLVRFNHQLKELRFNHQYQMLVNILIIFPVLDNHLRKHHYIMRLRAWVFSL